MDLVKETHEVPQVGVRVFLAANGLGGRILHLRPCSWYVHGKVEEVQGNLISDEVL